MPGSLAPDREVSVSAQYTTKRGDVKEVPVLINLPCPAAGVRGSVGVVLTHGASGDLSSGFLPAYAQALSDAGLPVLRFTCKPTVLDTRCAAMKAVLDSAADLHDCFQQVTAWLVGGHSMGSRVAVSVAADRGDVAGCILSSFPLHPPGEPHKLRDEPLRSLQLPLLFLRGTSDPFCTENQWQALLAQLASCNVQVHSLQGGSHALTVKGGQAAQQSAEAGVMAAAVAFATSVAGQNQQPSGLPGSGGAARDQGKPAAAQRPKQRADAGGSNGKRKQTGSSSQAGQAKQRRRQ